MTFEEYITEVTLVLLISFFKLRNFDNRNIIQLNVPEQNFKQDEINPKLHIFQSIDVS